MKKRRFVTVVFLPMLVACAATTPPMTGPPDGSVLTNLYWTASWTAVAPVGFPVTFTSVGQQATVFLSGAGAGLPEAPYTVTAGACVTALKKVPSLTITITSAVPGNCTVSVHDSHQPPISGSFSVTVPG